MRLLTVIPFLAFVGASASVHAGQDPFQAARERVSAGVLTGMNPVDTALCPAPVSAVATCFAPGTDPEYANAFYAWLREASGLNERYFLGGRWSFTATNGSTPPQGNGVTLTYSFPSDNLGGITGGQTTQNVLNSRLVTWYGSVAAGKLRFRDAFNRWEAVSGLRYVEVGDDDGAWGLSGFLGLRGDVRIVSITIDGPGSVLAFNFFPNNGDMVVDSADGFGNPSFFTNVVTHESGHGWGAQHVCPAVGAQIMEPFANGIQNPAIDDKRGVQFYYGDTNEPNNNAAQATNIGNINAVGTTVNDVSVVPGEVDFYRVTISTRGNLAAVADFQGQNPYQSYAQNSAGSGTCPGGPNNINPAFIVRLGLTVYASNGTTVIQDASAPALGTQVATSPFPVNPGEVYFVRVRGIDGSFDTQLYRLFVRSIPVACPGDANGDLVVNFQDLNIVLGQFGQSGPGLSGDVNGDGVVNFLDLNIVLSNFGTTC